MISIKTIRKIVPNFNSLFVKPKIYTLTCLNMKNKAYHPLYQSQMSKKMNVKVLSKQMSL